MPLRCAEIFSTASFCVLRYAYALRRLTLAPAIAPHAPAVTYDEPPRATPIIFAMPLRACHLFSHTMMARCEATIEDDEIKYYASRHMARRHAELPIMLPTAMCRELSCAG